MLAFCDGSAYHVRRCTRFGFAGFAGRRISGRWLMAIDILSRIWGAALLPYGVQVRAWAPLGVRCLRR